MSHPAKTPPPHTLAVDTNILWHRDKSEVVAPDFSVFLANLRSRMDLRLVVPEVVRGELLFQQTTSALKALTRANEQLERVGAVTGKTYSHRVTEKRVRREVEDRLDAWLHTEGAVLAEVPVEDMDWSDVIGAAIWRRPPFTMNEKNPEIEKGFRDALILESVCEICETLDDRDFAFLCADELLRETAERRLSHCAYFATYRSLEDFQSFIRLTEENLKEGFVRAISGKARRKFYSANDESSLWSKEKLADQLNERFSIQMEPGDDPSPFGALFEPQRWEPLKPGRFKIAGTRFDRLEEPRDFHWVTDLEYFRSFRGGGEGDKLFSFADFQRLLTLDIAVHWHAEVRSNGAFYNSMVDTIELLNRKFEPVFSGEPEPQPE